MKSTTSPVRVGLLGLGVLSQRSLLKHLSLIDVKEKIELVAVCDIDEDRASLTAEKYSVPEYYSQLENMLCRSSIDAVLVCTPIPKHYENALMSLQADKHVYIQKTLATSLESAQEIFLEAERRGLVVVASPLQMLNPARQLAKKILTENTIGPVYWSICTTNGGHDTEKERLGNESLSEIDPSWYFKSGGGPLYDMTVYAIDSLVGLFGPVRRVCALSGKRVPVRYWKGKQIKVDIDDNTLLLLDFGDSQYALVNGSNAHQSTRLGWGNISICGALGALEIYSENPSEPNLASVVDVVGEKTHYLRDYGPYLTESHLNIGDPHTFVDIMHFVDCVTSKTIPISDASRTCHIIEIIEKSFMAARTGKIQKIKTLFS